MDVSKEKVLNGEIAILKVVDMQGKFLRSETFNKWELIDLLIEPNSERMVDLITLYDNQEIVHNDERYSLLCGVTLICDLIIETAENMREGVDFTDIDEEKYDEYLRLKGL